MIMRPQPFDMLRHHTLRKWIVDTKTHECTCKLLLLRYMFASLHGAELLLRALPLLVVHAISRPVRAEQDRPEA